MAADDHALLAPETCSHAGSQMCSRCCWQQPGEAVSLVLRGHTARRALPVAGIVGTVLSLVNQGSVIIGGSATTATWLRVLVNYLVPFIVASVGYLSGRRLRPSGPDWTEYLAGFHEEAAGITERVLTRAVAGEGIGPYRWLVEPLRAAGGPVLDLACGSAPTRPLLAGRAWVGVDSSAGELALATRAGRGPLARCSAERLPAADDAAGAVCAAMCLQMLTPLDDVLSEVRRVLRPGGTIVALVPSRMILPRRGMLCWARTLRALGVRSLPWPNPRARDGLAAVLRGHGFVVDSDERRVFRRELADRADAEVLVESLYLPGADPERVLAAKHTLAGFAGDGRTVPLPLRRVVAHLPE